MNNIRAAIDFGSGAVKLHVSFADSPHSPLLTQYAPLRLTEDVAANGGSISKKMQEEALSILSAFKEAASPFYPVEFAAIATDVFRKALNGADLLQMLENKLQIPFQILSQDLEGKLGFLTACTLFPEIPPQKLVAWDMGSGSFQITTESSAYKGSLGHGDVRVILSKVMRKGLPLTAERSGNPISFTEAQELIEQIQARLHPLPCALQDQMKSYYIATFGGGESVFFAAATGLKKSQITYDEIQNLKSIILKKTDAELQSLGFPPKIGTSTLFIYALMDFFNIEQFHFKKGLGLTLGMLAYPDLWKNL